MAPIENVLMTPENFVLEEMSMSKRSSDRIVLPLLALLAVANCHDGGENAVQPKSPVQEEALAPDGAANEKDEKDEKAETAQLDAAKKLVDGFAASLKSALLAAVADRGPARAIESCAELAPALTAAAVDGDLRLRRVGTKIRNPKNAATERDAEALARLEKGEKELVLSGEAGFAYYREIRIAAPLCLKCHGKVDELSSEVRAQLAAHYPNDAAVGYAQGDLRGAFVVEAAEGP